jgi:hypothetical protein
MAPRLRFALLLAGVVLLAGQVHAASPLDSLKMGSPELQSVGPIAFGPEGILFIADPRAAAIVALDTQDQTAISSTDRPNVEGVDEKIASLIGIEANQLQINGLAVNPISGDTYLSVTRGKGPDGKPILVRIDRAGKLSEVALKDVKFARVALPNPGKGRQPGDVITDIAFVKGRVLVACLSNEEFSSQFRSIPFPFATTEKGTSIEIYHGSHAKLETKSPIRCFVAYEIKGEDNVLAAYTCTPLVKVPVAELKPGEKVKGKTIAELGNRNQPIDMIVYQKGGKDYILLANSTRGVMKISTEGIDTIEGITAKVAGTAGLKYDTVKSLDGTVHLDAFDKDHVLVLRKTKDNKLNLQTTELP